MKTTIVFFLGGLFVIIMGMAFNYFLYDQDVLGDNFRALKYGHISVPLSELGGKKESKEAFLEKNKAVNGITDTQILFGQTAAIGGPARKLGIGMRDGILAAFKEVNSKGGIHGRKLRLITKDDGYDPDKAVENTYSLINDEKVFSLMGGVGSPTANVVEPITSKNKVPFIGSFSGAEFLRDPDKRYVVNIRASYWQEIENWMMHLVDKLGLKRIAVFYQDDTRSRTELFAVKKALNKRKLKLVAAGSYRRNTIAIKRAYLKISEAKPEAIVMIAAYRPSATFIKLCKKMGLNPLFVSISFVGGHALSKELGKDGKGVIVTQVVPFPFDKKIPLVKDYQSAMEKYYPKGNIGFVSFEGYISARFVIDVLSKMNPEKLNRETFLKKIEEVKIFDINGFQLTFGDGDNQGSDQVFLTRIDSKGKFRSITSIK